MSKEIGAFEAKTRLSKLLEQVRKKGDRITITRHGVPIAQLVPVDKAKPRNIPDAIKELAEIRKRTKSGKESIRDLRDEGRRF